MYVFFSFFLGITSKIGEAKLCIMPYHDVHLSKSQYKRVSPSQHGQSSARDPPGGGGRGGGSVGVHGAGAAGAAERDGRAGGERKASASCGSVIS